MNVINALSRNGEKVPVYVEQEADTDEFGNVDYTWNLTKRVLCTRSYQNRNVTSSTNRGERHRDSPMLFFPRRDYPPTDSRIEFEGDFYEVNSITPQKTHVVCTADIVRNDFNP